MALIAQAAELSLMNVIFRVAGETILGCALKDIVNVAGRAIYKRVFPGEFEGCQIVVEIGLAPVIHRMALTAVLPETTFMGIILGMTGVTILWLRLEIGNRPGTVMAGRAGQGGVFSLQWKGNQLVVEGFTVSFFAVMAIQAARPISCLVGLGENGIQLGVAVLAYAGGVL